MPDATYPESSGPAWDLTLSSRDVTEAAARIRDAQITGGALSEKDRDVKKLMMLLWDEWTAREALERTGRDGLGAQSGGHSAGVDLEGAKNQLRACRPILLSLAMGLSASEYHEREAHTAFRWLLACIGESGQPVELAWCARRWLQHAIGRTRVTRREEQDISDLVLGEASPRRVRDVLLGDSRFMKLLISEWLLGRRLDLATAWRCELAGWPQGHGRVLSAWLLGPSGKCANWLPHMEAVCPLAAQHVALQWIPFAHLLLLIAAVAVSAVVPELAAFLAALWVVLVACSPGFGRVWAPRLLASVMVGWLALSTTGWAWEFAREEDHAATCAMSTIVLSALCFLYILVAEVERNVGVLDCRRSMRIWTTGAMHALATGLIGFAAIGGVADSLKGVYWLDPLANSSATILKLSPFALTIGLLTQTLWERDAVTEPL